MMSFAQGSFGRGRRTLRRVVAATLALSVIAAACGGDDDASPDTAASDAADTTAPDTADTTAPDTADTTAPADADTTAPDTADTTPETEATTTAPDVAMPPISERPELNIGFKANVTTFDIANGATVFHYQIAHEPLVRISNDGEFVPGLAAEFGYVGEGNTTYRIKLREGLRFSDGEPLNAEAVKTWFEYAATGTNQRLSVMGEFESIDVIDEYTLEWTLKEPNPVITSAISDPGQWGFVTSPAAIAKGGDFLATNTAGAGPYKLDPDQTLVGQDYVFVPNEYYYDQDAIQWSKVTVLTITDQGARLAALQAGQVDVISGAPLAAEGLGFEIVKAPPEAQRMHGIMIPDREGTLVPALGDVRVRQALNYAVDREAIAAAFGIPPEQVTDQMTTIDGTDLDYMGRYPYDPDMARQLLEEAGYGDGFSFEVLTFGNETIGGINGQDFMSAIGGYLEDVGVDLQIRAITTPAEYVELRSGGQMPAVQQTGIGGPMARVYRDFFSATGGANPLGQVDPHLEALYAEGRILPPGEAEEVWKEITRYATDQAYVLPIFNSGDVWLVNSDAVTNVALPSWDATTSSIHEWRPAD